MTITYHDTAPEFANIAGKGSAEWPADALKFSGPSLPAVGETVTAKGSLGGKPLGPARVVAYFIEGGFLGCVCEPLEPPPQFAKNVADLDKRMPGRPYRACYHLFGTELARLEAER